MIAGRGAAVATGTAAAPDGLPPRGWVATLAGWARREPRAGLWLALAAALIARVALVIRTGAVIDGDEALIGIQAERILRGQFPIYYYGQAYMGSLETYLIAGVIAVTGPQAWALRVAPILLSLALVYLTWRLARALLPKDSPATPLLAAIAALAAAVPPAYDAVTELRAWGGQIEVYVITVALLLATVELGDRLRAGAKTLELARRWGIWGLLAGLGFWVNPLIVYALVACAIWLGLALARRLTARRDGQAARWRDAARAAGVPALALVAGGALGGLPAWVYAIQTGGANIAVYLTQPAVTAYQTPVAAGGRSALALAITRVYATCAGPRVLDGALPGEAAGWAGWRLALLVPPLLAIALALVTVALRALAPRLTARYPDLGSALVGLPRLGLPLLYAGAVSAIFCLGTSAWPVLKGCELDLAGRYAVPLALSEPLLLLALVSAGPLWVALRPAGWDGNGRIARGLWAAALALLLAGGALQAASYGAATPQRTFQSPYYPYGMVDTRQLISYLASHHIHAAWCNHWIGNIVTFETDGQTVCADYYDQVHQHGIVRPPGSVATVAASATPSFILNLTDPDPILARELQARDIPYTIAVLKQSGVTVITPTRAVDPAALIAGLAQDYGTNLHHR